MAASETLAPFLWGEGRVRGLFIARFHLVARPGPRLVFFCWNPEGVILLLRKPVGYGLVRRSQPPIGGGTPIGGVSPRWGFSDARALATHWLTNILQLRRKLLMQVDPD